MGGFSLILAQFVLNSIDILPNFDEFGYVQSYFGRVWVYIFEMKLSRFTWVYSLFGPFGVVLMYILPYLDRLG